MLMSRLLAVSISQSLVTTISFAVKLNPQSVTVPAQTPCTFGTFTGFPSQRRLHQRRTIGLPRPSRNSTLITFNDSGRKLLSEKTPITMVRSRRLGRCLNPFANKFSMPAALRTIQKTICRTSFMQPLNACPLHQISKRINCCGGCSVTVNRSSTRWRRCGTNSAMRTESLIPLQAPISFTPN